MTDIPDRTAPIVGWRVWRTDDNQLTGTIMRSRWPIEPMEARCEFLPLELKCFLGAVAVEVYNHPAPQAWCVCGVYAAESLEALSRAYPDIRLAGVHPMVIGQIEMWGRIIKHDNGVYRAERARVKTLCYAPGQRVSRRKVEDLAKLYRVPVTVIPGFKVLSWKAWVASTIIPPVILLGLLLQTGQWNPLRLITMAVTGLDGFMLLFSFLMWQRNQRRLDSGLVMFWVLLLLMQFALIWL